MSTGGAEREHECTNGQIGKESQSRLSDGHSSAREIKDVETLQEINAFPSILHHHDASVCAEQKFNSEVTLLGWIFFSSFDHDQV